MKHLVIRRLAVSFILLLAGLAALFALWVNH